MRQPGPPPIGTRPARTSTAGLQRSMTSLLNLWRWAWYAILPASCTGCQTTLSRPRHPFFCDSCWTGLQPIKTPLCPRCGRPFASPVALRYSPLHLCGPCRTNKPAYSRAHTLYAYESPLREALHAFKYRHNLAMAAALGQLLIQALPDRLDVDLVIPVPLAPARLREREYNQSLVLADMAATTLRIPLDYLSLQRTKEGPPQTSLTRRARLSNLRRAFHVVDPTAIRGRRILLVDDVLTTGTTVNECAKALRKAGSGAVTVLTLARTMS